MCHLPLHNRLGCGFDLDEHAVFLVAVAIVVAVDVLIELLPGPPYLNQGPTQGLGTDMMLALRCMSLE